MQKKSPSKTKEGKTPLVKKETGKKYWNGSNGFRRLAFKIKEQTAKAASYKTNVGNRTYLVREVRKLEVEGVDEALIITIFPEAKAYFES